MSPGATMTKWSLIAGFTTVVIFFAGMPPCAADGINVLKNVSSAQAAAGAEEAAKKKEKTETKQLTVKPRGPAVKPNVAKQQQ